MMTICTDIQEIIRIIGALKPRLIGIDGPDGSGKSTLGKELVTRLGYDSICLDDYLNKKQGSYFPALNISKLKDDIKSKGGGLLVIEGVLLFKVLDSIGIKPDYCIYTTDGVWFYDWAEEYEGKYSNLTIKEIIDRTEKEVNKLNEIIEKNPPLYKMSGLRKEVYEYTYSFKPWSRANIVFRML